MAEYWFLCYYTAVENLMRSFRSRNYLKLSGCCLVIFSHSPTNHFPSFPVLSIMFILLILQWGRFLVCLDQPQRLLVFNVSFQWRRFCWKVQQRPVDHENIFFYWEPEAQYERLIKLVDIKQQRPHATMDVRAAWDNSCSGSSRLCWFNWRR